MRRRPYQLLRRRRRAPVLHRSRPAIALRCLPGKAPDNPHWLKPENDPPAPELPRLPPQKFKGTKTKRKRERKSECRCMPCKVSETAIIGQAHRLAGSV